MLTRIEVFGTFPYVQLQIGLRSAESVRDTTTGIYVYAEHDRFLPLELNNLTLNQALEQFRASHEINRSLTLLSRLASDPALQQHGIVFPGKPVNDFQQSCMHIVLGRGWQSSDEAFVIGFNLGCSNKILTSQSRLYGFATHNL